MFFLVQIKIDKDGKVSKGTSDFATLNDAVIQFHVAMSAGMQKSDTKKLTCLIIDEYGMALKSETFEA